LWIALATLILAGLAVVFVLPQLVSLHAPPASQADRPVAVEPAVVEGPAGVRLQAEQALQEFLQLRAKLELDEAEAWGGPAWRQADVRAESGDRLFGERRFDDAAQAYADALQKLRDLQERRGRLLDAAVDMGQHALAQDNIQAALSEFGRALAIDPDHELATRGLERARVRADVLEKMAEGKNAESENDLEAAQEAYREAKRLDEEYQPALDNLQRLSDQVNELRYNAAMSEALAAIDRGNFGDAEKALEAAAALRPVDSAVRDAQQRLAAARQQSDLSRLRLQAKDAEEKEDWQDAAELYRKALAVDASAAFAVTGLERVSDRLRLHQQLDHYLGDLTRLSAPEPLANAERLLSSLGEAPAGEPDLAEKVKRLKHEVAVARLPVPVRLESDGETEVVIYHVGRLGRFLEHQLELRPGTYTAVGSRPGYRDVRRVFRVIPGQPPSPVDIRCEEPV
jgi:tetratricopeptide (TPR) repeat protein